MSLIQITGDLLDWQAGDYKWNVLAHCVNCMGVQGSGVAKAIRDKYPSSYEDYRKVFESKELRLGEFVVSKIENDSKRIVHVAGQYRYGTEKRHLDYEAFYSAMEALRDMLEDAHKEGRSYTLAVPYKIGCNLAGGSFEIVSSMLHFLFDKSPVTCYIVRLPEKTS